MFPHLWNEFIIIAVSIGFLCKLNMILHIGYLTLCLTQNKPERYTLFMFDIIMFDIIYDLWFMFDIIINISF